MFITLLETSGNQHYIFSTNKLRENLGASELTRVAGERWVYNAVRTHEGKSTDVTLAIKPLRKYLLGQDSIFNSNTQDFEIVLAASGKAIVLTRTEELAKKLVQSVTMQALAEAPGLDICGAYLEFEPEGFDDRESFSDRFNQLLDDIHRKHAHIHAKRPGNATRFLRLPIIENCKTSNLPAAGLQSQPPDGSNYLACSATSKAKIEARKQASDRLKKLLDGGVTQDKNWIFPENSHQLEQALSQTSDNNWLAVVHADGNGLGQIFLNFATHLDNSELTLAGTFSKLRQFSIELDRCTENAFRQALVDTFESHTACPLPLVPLILGGDDLTILCDGRKALDFTVSFLTAFEQQTQNNRTISAIAQRALNADRLSACAGVAIVKPHFPFSVAYELAESLISSAKTVKKYVLHKESTTDKPRPYPSSALDFHILYDSSNANLKNIRKKLEITEGESTAKLTGKPYVITPDTSRQTANNIQDLKWLQHHQWSDFLSKVSCARAINDGDETTIPRSQAYSLRETLFSGIGPTDAFLNMLDRRYTIRSNPLLIESPDGSSPSLFRQAIEPNRSPEDPPKQISITSYLDALESVEFIAPSPPKVSEQDQAPQTSVRS